MASEINSLNWKAVITLTLLVGFAPTALAQNGRSDAASFVYGIWRIERVREVGGHASKSAASAEKQVGREIEFRRKSMSYEKDLLYFGPSCRRAEFTVKKQKLGKHDVGEKGTLEFYDLGPRRRGWIEYVNVKCGNGAKYSFERAEGEYLAIYYDGWFFFLGRIAN